MCGRYALYGPQSRSKKVRDYLDGLYDFPPRYNVAPSLTMPIVRMAKATGVPELTTARWGLIPFWAKDAKIGYSTINAQADTVVPSVTSASVQVRKCSDVQAR